MRRVWDPILLPKCSKYLLQWNSITAQRTEPGIAGTLFSSLNTLYETQVSDAVKKIFRSPSPSSCVEIHTANSAQLINLLIGRRGLKYLGQLISERGRASNTASGM